MWRKNVPSEVEIAYRLPFDVNYRIRLWCRYKIISLIYQQGPRAVSSNFRSDCAILNVTLELFPWTRNFAPIIWLLSSSTGIFSSVLLGLIAHLCHCRAPYQGKKDILDKILITIYFFIPLLFLKDSLITFIKPQC